MRLIVYFLSSLALGIMQYANANTQIEQPTRSFGYFIGDVLTQKINLGSEGSRIIEPELESGQRIGQYLFRMPSVIVHEGQSEWLKLRYQIINVPTMTEVINLPALTIKTASGDTFEVAPWQFMVSPLSSSDMENIDTLKILPDRSPLVLVKKQDYDIPLYSLAVLSIVLLVWFAWWVLRQLNDSRTLPFAKAKRIINQLPNTQKDMQPEAWIALHHAFNDIAGKTISTDSVHDIFASAPWLNGFKEDIERFYVASAARFFQQVDSAQEVGVATLCDALYRLEKRQAKSALSATAR